MLPLPPRVKWGECASVMRDFYRILGNTLFASVCNFFVWFAVTFWLYLETKSVVASSFVGGSYLVATTLSSFWFGSIVDHNRKKTAMMMSSAATAVFFGAALALVVLSPDDAFKKVTNPVLWLLVFLMMLGMVSGNIRSIALPTLATILVPDEREREKANGLSGTVMGISSSGAGFASGFALAYLGMKGVLAIGVSAAVLSLVHLASITVQELVPVSSSGEEPGSEPKKKSIDVAGTVKIVRAVPGLFGLIFFTTFNNFLGGVFMSLMDPYGLTLISPQAWGVLWGVLSTGFIAGGLYIAKYGLGGNPMRRMLLANFIIWMSSLFFTVQPSIVLFAAGILIWVLVVPNIEAAEQSVLQKVVPLDRQGRVFGFAQSMELSAAPLTAFLIGPLTQFVLIPFMTTGRGPELIGSWFGTGENRGMALAFIGASAVGLVACVLAFRSTAFKLLAERYRTAPEPAIEAGAAAP